MQFLLLSNEREITHITSFCCQECLCSFCCCPEDEREITHISQECLCSFCCCPEDEREITHISQECLCSFCKNTGSCARLRQIYTNTLVYICELELPTNRADGSTIPTDPMLFTIPSNPAYDVLRVLLLLSLHARNQVDDYSGTLGSICKKRCPHFSSGHKSLNCCTVSSSISKKKLKN